MLLPQRLNPLSPWWLNPLLTVNLGSSNESATTSNMTWAMVAAGSPHSAPRADGDGASPSLISIGHHDRSSRGDGTSPGPIRSTQHVDLFSTTDDGTIPGLAEVVITRPPVFEETVLQASSGTGALADSASGNGVLITTDAGDAGTTPSDAPRALDMEDYDFLHTNLVLPHNKCSDHWKLQSDCHMAYLE